MAFNQSTIDQFTQALIAAQNDPVQLQGLLNQVNATPGGADAFAQNFGTSTAQAQQNINGMQAATISDPYGTGGQVGTRNDTQGFVKNSDGEFIKDADGNFVKDPGAINSDPFSYKGQTAIQIGGKPDATNEALFNKYNMNVTYDPQYGYIATGQNVGEQMPMMMKEINPKNGDWKGSLLAVIGTLGAFAGPVAQAAGYLTGASSLANAGVAAEGGLTAGNLQFLQNSFAGPGATAGAGANAATGVFGTQLGATLSPQTIAMIEKGITSAGFAALNVALANGNTSAATKIIANAAAAVGVSMLPTGTGTKAIDTKTGQEVDTSGGALTRLANDGVNVAGDTGPGSENDQTEIYNAKTGGYQWNPNTGTQVYLNGNSYQADMNGQVIHDADGNPIKIDGAVDKGGKTTITQLNPDGTQKDINNTYGPLSGRNPDGSVKTTTNTNTNTGLGSSLLNGALATVPGMLALNYANNQTPVDLTNMNRILGLYSNVDQKPLYDTYNAAAANAPAFVNASIAPARQAQATAYGDLLQSQGKRGIRGSSFGTQDIANFTNSTNQAIGNIGTTAAQSALGLQGTLASAIPNVQNQILGQSGTLAGNISNLGLQNQLIKNDMFGRAFDTLGRGITPSGYGSGSGGSSTTGSNPLGTAIGSFGDWLTNWMKSSGVT